MRTLTTQKSIVCLELIYVWETILKALFIFNNKRKRSPFLTKKNEALFVWYVFISYSWTFHKLEKLFLVSKNAMKTLTTQKSIVWSELIYIWVKTLKALFVSNNRGKHCSFLEQQMHRCSVMYKLSSVVSICDFLNNNRWKHLVNNCRLLRLTSW